MSGIKLAPCNCPSAYQDKFYGKGVRVKNVGKDGKLVCTVCGKAGSQ